MFSCSPVPVSDKKEHKGKLRNIELSAVTAESHNSLPNTII